MVRLRKLVEGLQAGISRIEEEMDQLGGELVIFFYDGQTKIILGAWSPE